jgi:prepilin-type processing-associated H-X9-DG protein
LGRGKFQAKNTICKSNLRQMGMAAQMYVSSHGAYPGEWLIPEPIKDVNDTLMWFQMLEATLFPERRIAPFNLISSNLNPTPHPSFLCPLISPLVRPEVDWAAGPFLGDSTYPIWGHYAYNARGLSSQQGLGLMFSVESAIVSPSEMRAFGDPLSRSLNGDGYGRRGGGFAPHNDIIFPGFGGFEEKAGNLAKAAHSSRFNRVFCDGHVESEDFRKPFVASDDYLRRWNIDNQPHREKWR